MHLFQGCGAALVTPFNVGGGIDLAVFEKLINHTLAGGVQALFVCGTTGEPSTLTESEQVRVITAAVEIANKRVPVFAGCGSNDTAETVAFAKKCEACGADGLLAVTPYYNKCTQNGAVRHYAAISDAVHIPIIAYNVPARTGFSLAPETIARLASLENVRGIKEASGDVRQLLAVARLTHDVMDFYCGDDALTLPAMAMGACGVISVAANVIPRRMVTLAELCQQGKYDEAANLQFELAPFLEALFCEVNPIPCKKALEFIGISAGAPRLPLTALEPQHAEQLQTEMEKLGIFKRGRA
ncbi:MAG: 4-hydroxy-tetrahydrodipicolinate synthase [Clostridiales bacterium]|nr:4-hydroxy-tetrahydrodipicolinate synthase [Clostridiales bacterium]